MQTTSMTPVAFTDLPDEILWQIFLFLHPLDLFRNKQVSKHILANINDMLLLYYFPEPEFIFGTISTLPLAKVMPFIDLLSTTKPTRAFLARTDFERMSPMEIVVYTLMTDDINKVPASLLKLALVAIRASLNPKTEQAEGLLKGLEITLAVIERGLDPTLKINEKFVLLEEDENGFVPILPHAFINLAKGNLSDFMCPNLELPGCNLREANLEKSRFHCANFRNGHLQGAKLFNTELNHSYLINAYLNGANLEECVLADAILDKADLQSCKMRATNFENASMKQVNLYKTVLDGIFSNANLEKAHCEGAEFHNIVVKGLGMHLNQADLTNAGLFDLDFISISSFVETLLKGIRFCKRENVSYEIKRFLSDLYYQIKSHSEAYAFQEAALVDFLRMAKALPPSVGLDLLTKSLTAPLFTTIGLYSKPVAMVLDWLSAQPAPEKKLKEAIEELTSATSKIPPLKAYNWKEKLDKDIWLIEDNVTRNLSLDDLFKNHLFQFISKLTLSAVIPFIQRFCRSAEFLAWNKQQLTNPNTDPLTYLGCALTTDDINLLEPVRLEAAIASLEANQTDPNVQSTLDGLRKTLAVLKKDYQLLEVELAYQPFINLAQAEMENLNCIYVNLSWANLEKANLKDSHVLCSELIGANLHQANLESADICYCNLDEANCAEANLRFACTEYTSFRKGKLNQANLFCTNLSRTHMEEVDLENTELRETRLDFTHLEKAKLNGTFFNLKFIPEFYIDEESVSKATFFNTDDLPTLKEKLGDFSFYHYCREERINFSLLLIAKELIKKAKKMPELIGLPFLEYLCKHRLFNRESTDLMEQLKAKIVFFLPKADSEALSLLKKTRHNWLYNLGEFAEQKPTEPNAQFDSTLASAINRLGS